MPLPPLPGLHHARSVALIAEINVLRDDQYRAAPEFYPEKGRRVDALLDALALLFKAAR